MPLEVNDSGTWKEAQEIHVNDNGTWKQAEEVWVNDGGTWKQVFELNTVIFEDDFESGNLNKWTVTDGDFQIYTSPVYQGTYSAGIASTPAATFATTSFNPTQPTTIKFYWYETSSSTGGGIRLKNSNNDYECGFATNNPEWIVDHASGFSQMYSGSGYQRWVEVILTFDWNLGNFTANVTDLSDSTNFQNTYNLKNGVDIDEIEISNFNTPGGIPTWNETNSMYMWFDNFFVQ